jgi:hypothetical protein
VPDTDNRPVSKAGPEHAEQIGKIALNGAGLELIAARVLAWSMDATDGVAGVVAAQIQIMNTLNLIDAIAKFGDPGYPLDVNAVRSWVKQARSAVEARNRAIHDAWLAKEPGGEFDKVYRKGALAEPHDLVAINEQLLAALLAGAALVPDRPNPKGAAPAPKPA